jgi:hypothetical protein
MVGLSRARKLCTGAELRFVELCRGRALAKASVAQLKARITRARDLRDKWADAFTRQRRQAKEQQGFPANNVNARSREKSELFAEVLARVEAQLEAVTAPAKRRETAAAPKRAVKETGETGKKPRGLGVQEEDVAGQHPSRRQWADAATKRDHNKYGQQGASVAIPRSRIKIAGLDARIHAHVMSRGRRSQARRDSKNKR